MLTGDVISSSLSCTIMVTPIFGQNDFLTPMDLLLFPILDGK